MEFYRTMLMILIIILFIFVFGRLMNQRQKILAMNISPPPTVEGMETTSNEIATLATRYDRVKIKNTIASVQQLPLRELCIKSSYCSPWTGSVMSSKMINLILSRGYRYLDIPVYNGPNSEPSVCYSRDANTIDETTIIPLKSVFNTIASSAFSSISPNPADPLFIELRIIPDSTNLIYDSIADLIKSNFNERLYKDPLYEDVRAILIDGFTPLSELMGKIVFLVNITNNENFASASQKFAFTMNSVVGGSSISLKTYRQVASSRKPRKKTYKVVSYNMPPRTNIKDYTVLMPEINESFDIPNIYTVIIDYGIQITKMPFYVNNGMVLLYENIFDDQESAFIPMANMLINSKYYEKSKITYGFLSF